MTTREQRRAARLARTSHHGPPITAEEPTNEIRSVRDYMMQLCRDGYQNTPPAAAAAVTNAPAEAAHSQVRLRWKEAAASALRG